MSCFLACPQQCIKKSRERQNKVFPNPSAHMLIVVWDKESSEEFVYPEPLTQRLSHSQVMLRVLDVGSTPVNNET